MFKRNKLSEAYVDNVNRIERHNIQNETKEIEALRKQYQISQYSLNQVYEDIWKVVYLTSDLYNQLIKTEENIQHKENTLRTDILTRWQKLDIIENAPQLPAMLACHYHSKENKINAIDYSGSLQKLSLKLRKGRVESALVNGWRNLTMFERVYIEACKQMEKVNTSAEFKRLFAALKKRSHKTIYENANKTFEITLDAIRNQNTNQSLVRTLDDGEIEACDYLFKTMKELKGTLQYTSDDLLYWYSLANDPLTTHAWYSLEFSKLSQLAPDATTQAIARNTLHSLQFASHISAIIKADLSPKGSNNDQLDSGFKTEVNRGY